MARAADRAHRLARSRHARLLVAPWEDLDIADRVESLAAARESASQQVSDELDQDARLAARCGRPLWRSLSDVWDARIARLPMDDPRRCAYLTTLRETRASYQEDR